MRRVGRGAGVAVLIAGLGAGCQTANDSSGVPPGPAAPVVAEARFASVGGSSLTGAAIVQAYAAGVVLKVNFNGAAPGRYRVMIHETGNCSSPNGFSAGRAWAPPGVKIAEEGYPILKNDDSASYVVRLAGYRLEGPDGVMGRSVVVHAGGHGPLDAMPGIPNERIGCGVIARPTRPPILNLF